MLCVRAPELQERELTKFASPSALADTLRGRGLDEPAAILSAEVASAIFGTAFQRWIDKGNRRDLPELIRESLDDLNGLTTRGRRRPRAVTR